MSFIPPSQAGVEASKARVKEVQERALHYAEQHPYREPDPEHASLAKRLLRRLRGALRRERGAGGLGL